MKTYMRQAMKTFLLLIVVLVGMLNSARAYSLGGPIGNDPKPFSVVQGNGDAWQTPVIGYGLNGDLVAPKNLGEEYRRNLPVLYYACDASFLDYFGSNGVVALDQACALLTSAFTNNSVGPSHGVDGYSGNLTEFSLDTRHVNYQAQALGMFDLKSVTMGIFMEEFGLADPIRYTWTLHERTAAGPLPCPADMEYLVVQRNFDYFSTPLNKLQASPYVNDTLYSYFIMENCVGTPTALAVPYAADLSASLYSPVASAYGGYMIINTTNGLQLGTVQGVYAYGTYYTGLTRDDMAGLKYLLSSNNINMEDVDASSLLYTISTNSTLQQLFPAGTATNNPALNGGFYYYDGAFGYGDYGWLLGMATTNSPAALQLLYPGLVISSSSNYFVLATNWTYTQYFTNTGVGTVYPPVLTLVTASNAHPYLLEKYVTTFGNVFPNKTKPTTTIQQQTTTVTANTGAPYPALPVTNTVVKNITLNTPSGDFFLLPPFYTNYCPLDILYTGLTNVYTTTNFLTSANTNLVTATNTVTYSSTLIQISSFTNYTFVINPVSCLASNPPPALYEGIEKMTLVKSSYDSLLGQYFQPITNNYSLVTVTNSKAVVQHFQRIVAQPDVQFSASDIVTAGRIYVIARNVTFDQNQAYIGLAGPGTITTPVQISYNKSGPAYYNGTVAINDVLYGSPYYNQTPGGDVTDTFYQQYFVWGSYGGTTNDPVIYPDGTSIDNLESQILIQVINTPSGPLSATRGTFYNVLFNATGGAFSTPYTWASSGLPPGLAITSNSDNSATISGTPTQSGTFLFNLILTDSLGRSVQWTYSITIQ